MEYQSSRLEEKYRAKLTDKFAQAKDKPAYIVRLNFSFLLKSLNANKIYF